VQARVEELLVPLRERAARVDEEAAHSARSLADLAAAGVFGMLQPGHQGGLETSPVDFFRVVRAISGACTSTGWTAALLGIGTWHTALFAAAAQDDVWGTDVNTRVCSAHAPVGRLERVADGFLLSGRWRFASGVSESGWAILAAVEVDRDGRPVDFLSVLVPLVELRTAPSPGRGGLRGTDSHDIRAEAVVVPEHRTLRTFEVSELCTPGHQVNAGPLYRLPWGLMYAYAVMSPVLGAAEAGYRAFVEQGREQLRLSLGGSSLGDAASVRVSMARAASEIDAALLQTERNLVEAYRLAEAGASIPQSLRLRARRDQVRATERGVEAVDLLFRSRAWLTSPRSGPVERGWRDVHAARIHAANDVERAFGHFGGHELGLTVEDDLY